MSVRLHRDSSGGEETEPRFEPAASPVGVVIRDLNERLRGLSIRGADVASVLVHLGAAYAQRGGMTRATFAAVCEAHWDHAEADLALIDATRVGAGSRGGAC